MHEGGIGADVVERLIVRRGCYHLYDRLDPKVTAFVIVDMQNAFCKAGAPAEVPISRGIVGNINRLAQSMRAAGSQIVWVVSAFDCKGGRSDWENFFKNIVAAEVREKTMAYMSPGAEGTELWHELDRHEDDTLIVKNRYNSLVPGASQLERVLRSRGIETVVIAGTKTNICCETMARTAFDMDFNVVLVSDCCAALSDREHVAALENVIQQFGDVLSASEVKQRLT